MGHLESLWAEERKRAVVYLENPRKSTENLQELADFSGFYVTGRFSVARHFITASGHGRYYEMSDGTVEWRNDADVQRDKEVAASNEILLQHLEKYSGHWLWVDMVPVSNLTILDEVIRLSKIPTRFYGQVTASALGQLLRLYPYKMPVVYYDVDECLTPYELCIHFVVDDEQHRLLLRSQRTS